MTISLSHTVYLQYDFEKTSLSYIRFVEGFFFYPFFFAATDPRIDFASERPILLEIYMAPSI